MNNHDEMKLAQIIAPLPRDFASKVMMRIVIERLEQIRKTSAFWTICLAVGIALASGVMMFLVSSAPMIVFSLDFEGFLQYLPAISQFVASSGVWILPAASVIVCLYLLDGALRRIR